MVKELAMAIVGEKGERNGTERPTPFALVRGTIAQPSLLCPQSKLTEQRCVMIIQLKSIKRNMFGCLKRQKMIKK